VGFDVLNTCQPSTVWCSRERLPVAAAQPAQGSSEPVKPRIFFLFLDSSSLIQGWSTIMHTVHEDPRAFLHTKVGNSPAIHIDKKSEKSPAINKGKKSRNYMRNSYENCYAVCATFPNFLFLSRLLPSLPSIYFSVCLLLCMSFFSLSLFRPVSLPDL
jgi:hypothetical protein